MNPNPQEGRRETNMSRFLSEQYAFLKLSIALLLCDLTSHQDRVTIIHRDEFRSVCPRCGSEA